jgi:hypothetical protein
VEIEGLVSFVVQTVIRRIDVESGRHVALTVPQIVDRKNLPNCPQELPDLVENIWPERGVLSRVVNERYDARYF